MGGFLGNLILVVHVLIGLAVIVFVLLQHGKGADMGASFGSGASGSLFGASGSANFLSRTTAILATMFFLTSLTLAYLAAHRTEAPKSVLDALGAQSAPVAAPVAASAPRAAGELPK
jgi:preprotein translocase subunit SecG